MGRRENEKGSQFSYGWAINYHELRGSWYSRQRRDKFVLPRIGGARINPWGSTKTAESSKSIPFDKQNGMYKYKYKVAKNRSQVLLFDNRRTLAAVFVIAGITLLSLILFFLLKNSFYAQSCSEITSRASAFYTIKPDGKTPVRTYCFFDSSGAWAIINLSEDKNWLQFLPQATFVPAENGYVYPQSCASWREWFSLSSPQTKFAQSADCRTVTNPDRAYGATGNYYGCLWFIGKGPDGKVYNNPYTFYRTVSPNDAYRSQEGYCWNCKGDWWNTAPSIGANGSHCVAFHEP